jgi:hypothetical protein
VTVWPSVGSPILALWANAETAKSAREKKDFILKKDLWKEDVEW